MYFIRFLLGSDLKILLNDEISQCTSVSFVVFYLIIYLHKVSSSFRFLSLPVLSSWLPVVQISQFTSLLWKNTVEGWDFSLIYQCFFFLSFQISLSYFSCLLSNNCLLILSSVSRFLSDLPVFLLSNGTWSILFFLYDVGTVNCLTED